MQQCRRSTNRVQGARPNSSSASRLRSTPTPTPTQRRQSSRHRAWPGRAVVEIRAHRDRLRRPSRARTRVFRRRRQPPRALRKCTLLSRPQIRRLRILPTKPTRSDSTTRTSKSRSISAAQVSTHRHRRKIRRNASQRAKHSQTCKTHPRKQRYSLWKKRSRPIYSPPK